ncbi:MAG: hypothetical protein QGG62_04295 [Candidatus Poseidoniaceae archaeon]|nr:hypothetical protein [Candidatus Poseidoniaceae archaeon]
MRNRRAWVLALLFGLMILQVPNGESYPYGIENVPNGCTCHNAVPSETVNIVLEGVPDEFEANKTYTLNISVTGGAESVENHTNLAGFNLWMSRGILSNISEDVQVFSNNEVGHTEAGNDQRSWSVTWTAPMDEDLEVEYRLHVNTVNGDGIPSDQDHWNRVTGSINDEVVTPVSPLFLYGVPIVLFGIAALVYVREMRKLRQAIAEEE